MRKAKKKLKNEETTRKEEINIGKRKGGAYDYVKRRKRKKTKGGKGTENQRQRSKYKR